MQGLPSPCSLYAESSLQSFSLSLLLNASSAQEPHLGSEPCQDNRSFLSSLCTQSIEDVVTFYCLKCEDHGCVHKSVYQQAQLSEESIQCWLSPCKAQWISYCYGFYLYVKFLYLYYYRNLVPVSLCSGQSLQKCTVKSQFTAERALNALKFSLKTQQHRNWWHTLEYKINSFLWTVISPYWAGSV